VVKTYSIGVEEYKEALEVKMAKWRQKVSQFTKDNERVQKVFSTFCGEKDESERDRASKNLNREIQTIFDNFCISKWLKSKFVLESLKDEFKKINELPFTMDYIGLAGAGLQIKQCPVKILVRCENYSGTFKSVVAHIEKHAVGHAVCPWPKAESPFQVAQIHMGKYSVFLWYTPPASVEESKQPQKESQDS
jgi:hypothetical protein